MRPNYLNTPAAAGHSTDTVIFIVNVPKWILSVIWQLSLIFIVATLQNWNNKEIERTEGIFKFQFNFVWELLLPDNEIVSFNSQHSSRKRV